MWNWGDIGLLLVITTRGDYQTSLEAQKPSSEVRGFSVTGRAEKHLRASEQLITSLTLAVEFTLGPLLFLRWMIQVRPQTGEGKGGHGAGEEKAPKERSVVLRVARFSQSDILVGCALSQKKPRGSDGEGKGEGGVPSRRPAFPRADALCPDAESNRRPGGHVPKHVAQKTSFILIHLLYAG